VARLDDQDGELRKSDTVPSNVVKMTRAGSA
jgi:hypothetical protein